MATLISEAEAKASIGGLGRLAGEDQQWLTDAIEALTPVIEQHTGPILMRPETVVVDGGLGALTLPWPIHTLVSVSVDGETVPTTGYTVVSSAGVIIRSSGLGWPTGKTIVVEAIVGREEVPANVKMAARELIRFWWQQGRQGGAAFGASDQGDFAVPQGFLMPNRVISLLAAGPKAAPGFA